jgi:glycosyltransferase involved in cell wall biosynthesis
MAEIRRLILLNQMAGPLFRELAEGLAPLLADGCLLLTGHPDTLARRGSVDARLRIVPAPAYDRGSLARRLVSWLKYLLASTRTILGAGRHDVFLIVSNPPILGGWFWLLNLLRRRPYAVLVYDIHPDVLITMGLLGESNPVVDLWRWFNNRLYRNAAIVITLGPHMAQRLARQYSRLPAAPAWVPPWADVHNIRPLPERENPLAAEFNPEGKRVVLYSGNMGVSHDIDSILEAARLLADHEDILFLFIGAGEKWQTARDFRDRHGLTNIAVHAFQPEERLPYTMSLASVSLVALDAGAEDLMIPSKVFYYLAAGAAVIGICSGRNELQEVIDGSGGGLCVPPGEPRALAEALTALLVDEARLNGYRESARRAACDLYSREAGVRRFTKLLVRAGLFPADREAV